MVLNGVLVGLVLIIVEFLILILGVVILIGMVGGVIVVFVVLFLDKLKIDDVVGVIFVYLFVGIWGIIVVIFINDGVVLGIQLYGIIVIGGVIVVMLGVVWFILKVVMGLCVSEEDEINGLDMVELGMEVYFEFLKG